jgi:hypothetical protein
MRLCPRSGWEQNRCSRKFGTPRLFCLEAEVKPARPSSLASGEKVTAPQVRTGNQGAEASKLWDRSKCRRENKPHRGHRHNGRQCLTCLSVRPVSPPDHYCPVRLVHRVSVHSIRQEQQTPRKETSQKTQKPVWNVVHAYVAKHRRSETLVSTVTQHQRALPCPALPVTHWHRTTNQPFSRERVKGPYLANAGAGPGQPEWPKRLSTPRGNTAPVSVSPALNSHFPPSLSLLGEPAAVVTRRDSA